MYDFHKHDIFFLCQQNDNVEPKMQNTFDVSNITIAILDFC